MTGLYISGASSNPPRRKVTAELRVAGSTSLMDPVLLPNLRLLMATSRVRPYRPSSLYFELYCPIKSNLDLVRSVGNAL